MDRWIIGIVVAAGVLVAFPGAAVLADEPESAEAAGPAIHWLRSASEAARAAAGSSRPILVYVRSASCGYCDLLQRNVWQNPQVIGRIEEGFVPLKLTQEENREQLAVLDVKAFPSILVFSPKLEYLFRIDGYVDAQEFMRRIERVSGEVAALAEPQPAVRR